MDVSKMLCKIHCFTYYMVHIHIPVSGQPAQEKKPCFVVLQQSCIVLKVVYQQLIFLDNKVYQPAVVSLLYSVKKIVLSCVSQGVKCLCSVILV